MVLQEPKLLPAQIIDHAKPLAAAPPTELVARGEHLASVAGCRSCHRTDLTGNDGPPPGRQHHARRHRHLDERRFLPHAPHRPHARQPQLAESMPRALGNMSDEELEAIWAYLKTVPPEGEKSPRQMARAGAPATNAAAA